MANSVDPDQRPHSVASELGLHCLQRLYISVPILKVDTVFFIFLTKRMLLALI